jgi:hypothetical protein
VTKSGIRLQDGPKNMVILILSAVWCFVLNYFHLGPVVYFKVLGREFIVLNSVKAINDLLNSRGANYSTRPSFQMLSDLYV